MKTRLTGIALLTLMTLAAAAFIPSSFAQTNKAITKKELKVLLKTAKTPAEHRTIANYYRQEAQRLTSESQSHAAEAEVYAKHPPFTAMESKHGYAFGKSASHCRFWSKEYLEQAAKATKLAGLHEDMAQKAEQQSASLFAPVVAR